MRAAALQAVQSPGESVEGLRSLFSHSERESVDAQASGRCRVAPCPTGAPGFPEVGVPQGRVGGDALVRVVGQHLVEQREGWGRALGDQAGDPGAFFRGEVEVHGPGPGGGSEREGVLPAPENGGSLKERRLLLELLEDALIRRPQHVVDLGGLVHLVGSGKQRVQTEKKRVSFSSLTGQRSTYTQEHQAVPRVRRRHLMISKKTQPALHMSILKL